MHCQRKAQAEGKSRIGRVRPKPFYIPLGEKEEEIALFMNEFSLASFWLHTHHVLHVVFNIVNVMLILSKAEGVLEGLTFRVNLGWQDNCWWHWILSSSGLQTNGSSGVTSVKVRLVLSSLSSGLTRGSSHCPQAVYRVLHLASRFYGSSLCCIPWTFVGLFIPRNQVEQSACNLWGSIKRICLWSQEAWR